MPGTSRSVALATACLLVTGRAIAFVSFDPPEAIVFGVHAETGIGVGTVATDGAGTWIVASNGYLACCDEDIVYQRSTDGGVTWGASTQLNDETVTTEGSDISPQLAGDGAGNWVAVWAFRDYDDPVSDYDVLVSTSSDDGATWSAPQPLGTPSADAEWPFDLATDGAGTWIATWVRAVATPEIYVSRSTDDGATWTSTLFGLAASSPANRPRLSTDRAGTWVVVWMAPGTGGDYDVRFRRSVDNGVSFGPPAFLNTDAGFDARDDFLPDVGADASGSWVAVWHESPGEAILGARSTDGATWTPPMQVNAFAIPQGFQFDARVAAEGNGRWIVAWSSAGFSPSLLGEDSDILFARSRDGGATWSAPSAVYGYASSDNRAFSTGAHLNGVASAIDADGSGTWVVGYAQTSHCCSSDVFYRAVSRRDCPVVPSLGCKQTLTPGGGTIQITDSVARDDMLAWRWTGEATDPAELGNPLLTSDYVLCVYDETGDVPALAFERDVRAGGQQCGPLFSTKDCWKATATGFAYSDRRRIRSAVGRMKLRAGGDGRAMISLKGRGFAVVPPFLPLANDSRVRSQLHNLETGACWAASFAAPAENSSIEYRASSE